MSGRLASFILHHPFAVLSAAASASFGVHLLTIAEYPPAWFDEIEILEMGRFSIFDVMPDWSVNLIPQADGTFTPPYPYFHYLSGALLEALYRLTGGFLWGRAVMLASLPCCALALFTWLRTKPIAPAFAFVAALLFLIDPNATICAHWYRPDLWCMAMTLIALALICKAEATRFQRMWMVLAGSLTATAIFFWITAVLFLPLAFLETCSPDGVRPRPKIAFRRLASVFVGGALATAILLIPLYPYIPDILSQYMSKSEIATLSTVSDSPLSAFAGRLLDFVKIACRSPFVWGAAVVGLLYAKRFRLHAILFLATAAFILSTRVYHLRMVYLMPYLLLLAAAAVDRLSRCEKRLVAGATRAYLALALTFGVTLSVGALNLAAWPEGNTLDALSRQLQAAIPMPSPKVYLHDFEHELYYAGRRNGWRMYSTSPRELIFSDRYERLLDELDAVTVSATAPELTEYQRRILSRHGFVPTCRISMPPSATGALKQRLATIFYAHGYPDCEIWRRRQ